MDEKGEVCDESNTQVGNLRYIFYQSFDAFRSARVRNCLWHNVFVSTLERLELHSTLERGTSGRVGMVGFVATAGNKLTACSACTI